MKKLFTLWLALLFGLVANAQTKFVKSVPTLTELVALNVADIHTNVLVNSYWTSNTNSVGALFQWVPGATDATNTTSVFAPASGTGRWIRVELPANPGSATQPGFRFLGDDNTGIYNSGADAIDFSTGGSRRWGITSTGVLQAQGGQSISTTASSLTLSPSGSVVMSPGGSSKWTFNSSGNLVGTASYGGIYGGSGVPLSLNSGSGTDAVTLTINGTEGARLATTGYLGVGTTGPDRKLDVLDASNPQLRLTQADGTVFTDAQTLSTGHTLITNTYGTRITSTVVNDTSVSARQIQGGLAFDGVTTTAKDLHTIGANIGTSDFSIASTVLVPSSNPSASIAIATISSSGLYGANDSLLIFIDVSGALNVRIYDALGGYINASVASIISSYGGKIATIACVRNATTPSMTVYINGVAQTVTTTTSGAATWANTLTSTYLAIGYGSSSILFNSTIFSATLFNRALSASEVVTLANQGIQESDKWGSLTAKYDSNRSGGFDTGADGWTASAGLSSLTGNIDGIGGEDNWLRLTSDNTTLSHRAEKTISELVVGKRYRVSYKYYMPVAANGTAKRFVLYEGSTYALDTVSAPTNSVATTRPSFEFTLRSSNNIRFYLADSDGNLTFTGTAGDLLYIKDVTFTEIGSILDADLSAGVGYQVPDRSSNKYHGVVSASGTAWTLPQRRGQIRYTTTGAATGAFQLLSSTAIPANALIQSIVAWSAGTPLVYVGNATGTSNIAVHTTLAASTYTKLALTNDFSTTGNLWLNKSATNEVNLTVNYMIADP